MKSGTFGLKNCSRSKLCLFIELFSVDESDPSLIATGKTPSIGILIDQIFLWTDDTPSIGIEWPSFPQVMLQIGFFFFILFQNFQFET